MGKNDHGQLGDGTTTNRSQSGPCTGYWGESIDRDLLQFPAGEFHSIILEGPMVSVWVVVAMIWGNWGMELIRTRACPLSCFIIPRESLRILSLMFKRLMRVAFTPYCSNPMATLWATGKNAEGQLGDGTFVDRS